MRAQPDPQTPSSLRWVVPFAAAIFAMLTVQMSNLGFSPLLPDIQRQFHLNFSQIGLFTGMYGIIGIALSVPAGLLARRYGEGIVLAIALLIVAAGLCSLAASPGFGLALVSRAFWLCGYRIAFVCVVVAVAVTAPPRFKGSSMGMLGAISASASVVGSPLGAAIGAAFGWRFAFLAFAGMALLGGAAIMLFYVKGPDPQPHRITLPSDSAPARQTATVWVMAATIGLVNMGGFTMTFFAPSILHANFHAGPRQAALVLSTAYAAAIVANVLFGLIADKTDRLYTIIALSILLILSASFLGVSSERGFALSVVALISLGLAATNQGYALVGAAHDKRATGPAMGIVSLGSGVYAYIGPQFIGILRDRTGSFQAGFHVLLAAACLSLVLLVGLKLYQRSRSGTLASQTV